MRDGTSRRATACHAPRAPKTMRSDRISLIVAWDHVLDVDQYHGAMEAKLRGCSNCVAFTRFFRSISSQEGRMLYESLLESSTTRNRQLTASLQQEI